MTGGGPRGLAGPAGSADDDARRAKRHLDEKLDEALRGTFPASDAVEIRPED